MLVLIWGLRKANCFCDGDWTTQISLKRLVKFDFARASFQGIPAHLVERIW
jgi:hypothetical protein